MIRNIAYIALGAALSLGVTGCNDFLDREPLDKVTPNVYFSSEDDLAAYTINLYPSAFASPEGALSGSPFMTDNHTDNQAGTGTPTLWAPGLKLVPASEGVWTWTSIRNCNYFMDKVMPKYESGELSGANVAHYIGEMKVLRAYFYYQKLVSLGDLPIIIEALPDQEDVLVEASKRKPRNEVARFILSELQDAIDNYLLDAAPNANKTRISKKVAQLIRARVALFEGTWEKYHKGTAFVPGGEGWPGNKADLKADFNIDTEIEFFLSEAMKSSKEVASSAVLSENTAREDAFGEYKEGMSPALKSINPYYTMFCDEDLSSYEEVLMWRQYKEGLFTHNIQMEFERSGGGSGWTRGMVESFLMKNGLPIYASNSGYNKEWEKEGINKTLTDRDSRLVIFTKKPGDANYYNTDGSFDTCKIDLIFGSPETNRATTGFIVKKGKHYSSYMANNANVSTSGFPIFRSAEALLIYMEACYEKNGNLDADAQAYWRKLRNRAGVNEDFQKTIDNTIMTEEAKNDFAAYSHGKLVDATIYNIRRERRNELCAEALRWEDLKRWRACDQLVDKAYHIEGMLFWGSKYETELKDKVEENPGSISTSEISKYLLPYERVTENNPIATQGGFKFNVAHYLEPIGMAAFRQTATDKNDFETSVIYQNPGWSKTADTAPTF